MYPHQEEQTIRRRRRQLQVQVSQHDKEADEANASGAGGTVGNSNYDPQEAINTTTTTPPTDAASAAEEITETETTTSDIHQQDIHQSPPEEQQTREQYEALFTREPEQPPATTFSLFSDPNRFNLDSIHASTHYLTEQLQGSLWLDANGDGKRGSETNATLNAMEYDTGIGGVTVSLIRCSNTNEKLFQSTSQPNVGGQASSLKRTEVSEAGEYAFPLDTIDPGRYYVMYKAPKDYRLSGNVLPLERKMTEDGAYFECIPKGGEGDKYIREVKQKGDLDWGGYCARSIGCLEVEKRFNLSKEYADLEILKGSNGSDGQYYEGTTPNLVALPSKTMLHVGLAEEEWELATYQYADATVTLSFPGTVSVDDLRKVVPADFARSGVKRSLEGAFKEFIGGDSVFDVQGVEFHGGEIIVAQVEDKAAVEELPTSRWLRGLEGDEEEASLLPQGDTTAASTQVTYTITTRGKYRPPPFEQLGAIMTDSINADPQGLVKSLKDKEGLPPVFNEVEGANARHLTVKVPEKKAQGLGGARVQILNETSDTNDGMASWATVPIILLSLLISALMGTLLFRRVFVRRKKKRKVDYLSRYLMSDSGFAVSHFNPQDDKKNTIRDPSGRNLSRNLGDNTLEPQAVSSDQEGLRQSQNSRASGQRRIKAGQASTHSAPSDLEEVSEEEQQRRRRSSRRRKKKSRSKSASANQVENAHDESASGHTASHTSSSNNSSLRSSGQSSSQQSAGRSVGTAGRASTNSAPCDLEEALEEQERRRRRRRKKKSRSKSAVRSSGGSVRVAGQASTNSAPSYLEEVSEEEQQRRRRSSRRKEKKRRASTSASANQVENSLGRNQTQSRSMLSDR